jgi:hypothetical protein
MICWQQDTYMIDDEAVRALDDYYPTFCCFCLLIGAKISNRRGGVIGLNNLTHMYTKILAKNYLFKEFIFLQPRQFSRFLSEEISYYY